MARSSATKTRNHDRPAKERSAKEPVSTESGNSIKLYSDSGEGGWVDLNFSLPLPVASTTRRVARLFAEKMGLTQVTVRHLEPVGEFTTLVSVVGRCLLSITAEELKADGVESEYDFFQINAMLKKVQDSPLGVVGVSLGEAANTVALDTLFNAKGYRGDVGFERYPQLHPVNLRGNNEGETVIKALQDTQARVLIASVSEGSYDAAKTLVDPLWQSLGDSLKSEKAPVLKICLNSTLTDDESEKLGFDKHFGPGHRPSEVLSWVMSTLS